MLEGRGTREHFQLGSPGVLVLNLIVLHDFQVQEDLVPGVGMDLGGFGEMEGRGNNDEDRGVERDGKELRDDEVACESDGGEGLRSEKGSTGTR